MAREASDGSTLQASDHLVSTAWPIIRDNKAISGILLVSLAPLAEHPQLGRPYTLSSSPLFSNDPALSQPRNPCFNSTTTAPLADHRPGRWTNCTDPRRIWRLDPGDAQKSLFTVAQALSGHTHTQVHMPQGSRVPVAVRRRPLWLRLKSRTMIPMPKRDAKHQQGSPLQLAEAANRDSASPVSELLARPLLPLATSRLPLERLPAELRLPTWPQRHGPPLRCIDTAAT